MIKTKGIDLLNKCESVHEREIISNSLGGLMYSPAHNSKAAEMLTEKRYTHLRSFALCLEDAIADGSEKAAIEQIKVTFKDLGKAVEEGFVSVEDVPYLFIRVKNPEQINEVYESLESVSLLTGFIFPKFDTQNAQKYLEAISKINKNADNILYGMPIIESESVSDIRTRIKTLGDIRDITDSYRRYILNIRIGGNDFCSSLGVRRSINQSIYEISAVSSIIGDIVSIFSKDYVVSAPVWDYFSSSSADDAWEKGLRKEISLDLLNGLTGKTAIHPSQLQIINESLMVSEEDFRDAYSILTWSDSKLAVSKSFGGNRMNEAKVHRKWAEKIIIRAAVYGITDVKGII